MLTTERCKCTRAVTSSQQVWSHSAWVPYSLLTSVKPVTTGDPIGRDNSTSDRGNLCGLKYFTPLVPPSISLLYLNGLSLTPSWYLREAGFKCSCDKLCWNSLNCGRIIHHERRKKYRHSGLYLQFKSPLFCWTTANILKSLPGIPSGWIFL